MRVVKEAEDMRTFFFNKHISVCLTLICVFFAAAATGAFAWHDTTQHRSNEFWGFNLIQEDNRGTADLIITKTVIDLTDSNSNETGEGAEAGFGFEEPGGFSWELGGGDGPGNESGWSGEEQDGDDRGAGAMEYEEGQGVYAETGTEAGEPEAVRSGSFGVSVEDGSGLAEEQADGADTGGPAEEQDGGTDFAGYAEGQDGGMDQGEPAEEQAGGADFAGYAEGLDGGTDQDAQAEEQDGGADFAGYAEGVESDGSGLREELSGAAFTFIVEFEELEDGFVTVLIDGAKSVIEIIEGKITIELKHGQEAVIKDLPVGTRYIVAEVPVPGYIAAGENHEGIVPTEGITADFVNCYSGGGPGKLIVSKTVTAVDPGCIDTDKEFRFVVTIDGEETVIGLRHDEREEFVLLPGVGYSVREDDYTDEGYEASAELAHYQGEDGAFVIEFRQINNYKGSEGTEEPEKPDKPDKPDKPQKPDKPENPGKPGAPGHAHTPAGPKTGDESNILLWMIMMAVSVSALIGLLLYQMRRQASKEKKAWRSK